MRGGRRPNDQPGSAPLVLLVGDGHDAPPESERILSELSFAVAPAADVDDALRVLENLQPDLIVARSDEAARLRAEASVTVPIVEYQSAGGAGSLLERMRGAIRNRR